MEGIRVGPVGVGKSDLRGRGERAAEKSESREKKEHEKVEEEEDDDLSLIHISEPTRPY